MLIELAAHLRQERDWGQAFFRGGDSTSPLLFEQVLLAGGLTILDLILALRTATGAGHNPHDLTLEQST